MQNVLLEDLGTDLKTLYRAVNALDRCATIKRLDLSDRGAAHHATGLSVLARRDGSGKTLNDITAQHGAVITLDICRHIHFEIVDEAHRPGAIA